MFVVIQRLLAEPEVQGALVGSCMAAVCWGGLTMAKTAKSHLEMWILTRRNGGNGNGKAKPKVCDFHSAFAEKVEHLIETGAETQIELTKVGTDVIWIKDKMKDDDINFRALYKKIDSIKSK